VTITFTPAQAKIARRLLGWSIATLSVRSGLGIHIVGKFEVGERKMSPTAMTMLRIALEAGGVEFLTGNAGVRLREPK
jgi:hypothetical protein